MKENKIEFLITGRHALFTDPITRIGGEKTSYHLPTYEALKGVCKSIYWKPSIIWYIDKVRVINPIRTQTKGMKPIKFHKDENDLAYYTYLHDVAYQVQAHFEWNMHRVVLFYSLLKTPPSFDFNKAPGATTICQEATLDASP